MEQQIILPALAEGIESGDVVSVLVNEGDPVREGQNIIELETDKATVPVPATYAGRIAKLHVKKGDKIRVGQPIAAVETGDSGTRAQATAAEQPLPAKPPSAPEQRTVTTPPPSPATAPPPVASAGRYSAEHVIEYPSGREVPASPSVRRLARELGVDLSQVQGSARGGRITEDDIKTFVKRETSLHIPAATEARPTPSALPDFTQWGPIRREKINNVRRRIAANMARAWLEIPHVHQFHDADITELLDLQKRYAAKFKERGATLTLTSLILKAVTHALRQYPQFNASFDVANEEIIFKDYYHIGVAVDTPAGLIVPVLRDVDKKGLFELALELSDLAKRTRERQIELSELRGATFTVTNLGGMGAGAFTPIINPPEVAILGVGRASTQPVWREGQWLPRTILPLCVAYDHRVIDGADGARFIAEVGKILEDYEAMFLGL